jgi:lysophospholipase L1-like esterase
MLKDVKKFRVTILDLIILSIFLVISGYFYIGFFKPAPSILEGSSVRYLILGIKVVLPLIILGVISLYFSVRLNKISLSSVILLFVTFIIIILIAYPIVDHFYQIKSKRYFTEYHSFMQRNPPLPYQVDTTNYNVFCLGGSTTKFTDSDGRDWPGLVEKKLSDQYNIKRVKVYNLGEAWYTTQHSLINYIQNLRKYKPNLILIMHGINDAWMNADFSRFSKGKFREDYGHYLGAAAYIVKFPNLISYVKDSFNLLWYADKIKEIDTDYFPGLTSFERNINTIIELGKANGSRVVLLTQPNLYKDSINSEELKVLVMLNQEAIGNGKKWSYKTAFSALKQYNEKTREISKKQSVFLIDLEKIIPKSLEYLKDDVHYKDKSFDLIAASLAEKIAPIISQNRH